jgi:general secretion pathway protein L
LFLGTIDLLDVYVRLGKVIEHLGSFDPQDRAQLQAVVTSIEKRRRGTRNELTLRLLPNVVVHERLTLPVGVRDVLAKVLANQIERLAPWPREQALLAFREKGRDTAGNLQVDVWIAGRERIGHLLEVLSMGGLIPRVIDVGSSPDDDPGIDLSPLSEFEHVKRRKFIARALAAGLAVAFAASAATGGWAWFLARDHERIAGDLRSSLAKASSIRSGDQTKLSRAATAALALRKGLPVASIVIEALSRALPDDAYVDRLEMRDGVITIAGQAVNAPGLIAAIERSPHFKGVEFAAPTTREAGSLRSVFSISAKLEPKMTLEEQ